jgi:hypothetical protein
LLFLTIVAGVGPAGSTSGGTCRPAQTGAVQEGDMQTSSRYLAFVVLGGALTLAACGGSDVSPVASTTALPSDGGSVTSSGYGPGTSPSPAPAPGTGTCTNDCDGTGQGPAPGAGNGYGPANAGGGGKGYGPGSGPSDGLCGNACAGPVGPDPTDIATLLVEALQEEYKAEMLYRSVLGTFGAETVPFALIEQAEARHVAALQMLFTRRQMAAPASAWAPGSFAPFASVPLACAAGVVAEQQDAAFYDRYLPRTDLPQDVRNVFTNLQRASLESHLRAFESCQ